MDIDYIVVQAGGMGTRLEHLTANKPKALVPFENLPIIFHLFKMFPDKRFIIIADYKKEVLHEYLASFASVKYQVVDANGEGTCSGVREAIKLLPDSKSFMLIWSDLILPESFSMPTESHNYLGVSCELPCRWVYQDGLFTEKQSTHNGVVGLFIFINKAQLIDIPESGELVRWLQEQDIGFIELQVKEIREIGLLSEYEALEPEKCRPFNKISLIGDKLLKEPIDEQGLVLAQMERKWYSHARDKGVQNIPLLYSIDPLIMERINGKNVYEYSSLSHDAKKNALSKIISALKELHCLGSIETDSFSMKEAYFNKTIARLSKVRDLIPFSDRKTIIINGRECRNVYSYKHDLEKKLANLQCDRFHFIHGDCTFSNIMLRNDTEAVFIDPRGYFGFTELFGDPNYDWAKLYYSLVGNYDRFNLKEFRLSINQDDVILDIASNGWEELEQLFFALTEADPISIRIIHSIIWLSLTTYAWQDYDSLCGAFYNGLYYMEEAL